MDVPAQGLLDVGRAVRDRVRVGALSAAATLARPQGHGVGDLQYTLDGLGESGLAREVLRRLGDAGPLRLLSEGLPEAGTVLVPGSGGRLCVVDPVDGTRGLMHDKRSAWFLAGLAPDQTGVRLRHLTHACMVEIPHSRSHLSDVLVSWPDGVASWTEDVDGGTTVPLPLRPSRETELAHGFATVCRFTGGAAAAIGAFQDALLRHLHPGDPGADTTVYEDQYICNAGQLHALMTGRDRFVADVRPLFHRTGGRPLLCAHPYDLLALPIAESAGVVVTDPGGRPLDAPLDLGTPVAWVAYASEALRARVEPALRRALADCGLGPCP